MSGCSGYKNSVFSVLFLCVCVALSAVGVTDLELHPSSARESYILVMCCVLSAALGLITLCFWVWWPEFLLRTVQPLSIASILCLAFYALIADGGSTGLAVTLFVLCGLLCGWWYGNSDARDFASVVLEMVSSVVRANPILLIVCAIIVLVQTVWFCFISIAAVQAMTYVSAAAHATGGDGRRVSLRCLWLD